MNLKYKDFKYLEKLIDNFSNNKNNKLSYPLLDDAFSNEDIISGIKVLLSKQLTMSEITYKFEKSFANYIGAKHALMVNSGSSANLLAAFASINPLKKNRAKRDSFFIIPSLCWSTSLWPFVQAGLKPIFLDVNINNFCLDETKISKSLLKKVKIILTIHILGNSNRIDYLKKISKQNDIILIEDTCEALGSKYKSKYLGTFGDFGTYSFYYSHQITSGEGGMIVCNNSDDYKILRTLRAHGWDRGQKKNYKNENSFNFINSGFNLRPTDINAAIGFSQFKRLNLMKKNRLINRNLIIKKMKKSPKWDNQYIFFEAAENLEPSYFGFPLILNKSYLNLKNKIMKDLNINGIETRPILSGNFLNQPSAKLYKFRFKKNDFLNSQYIEDNGFFIGLPIKILSEDKLNHLVSNLLKY